MVCQGLQRAVIMSFESPCSLNILSDFLSWSTSARNSGNSPSSFPHPSSPCPPPVNSHPSADQLHIRVRRRRPRWLSTNGSSVICVKSQCLFWLDFFLKLNWPFFRGKKVFYRKQCLALHSFLLSLFLYFSSNISCILFFKKIVYCILRMVFCHAFWATKLLPFLHSRCPHILNPTFGYFYNTYSVWKIILITCFIWTFIHQDPCEALTSLGYFMA